MIVMFKLLFQVCGPDLLAKNMEVLSTAQGTKYKEYWPAMGLICAGHKEFNNGNDLIF